MNSKGSASPRTPDSPTSTCSLMNEIQPSKVLQEMVTTDGTNLLELSQRHLVMVSFLKFLGCPMCQHVVYEVGRMMPEFLKLNVIPVLAYQESKQAGEAYFTNSKELNVPIIPRVANVSPSIHQAFGMKKKGFMDHMGTIPANLKLMVTENRGMQLPAKCVKNPFVEFGLFLIHQGKLLNKFQFKSLGSRPDYGEFLLMIKSEHRLSQVMPPIEQYIYELRQMFPKVHTESKPTLLPSPSQAATNDNQLDDILSDPKTRLLFKVFSMNECSVENVLLYENIEEFKNIQDEKTREKKAEAIFNIFLSSTSNLEVNTSKELVIPIEEAIRAKKADTSLFNDIEADLKVNVMRDTFLRFKQAQQKKHKR